ncbi:MAG: helix-turn-helix domain-containing protein [Candidatus Bathyarchaeia archaeon]
MSKEETYTTGEAARLIGVSFRTIKRWISSEKISVLKTPSGRYCVPKSEIERIRGLMSRELEELSKIKEEILELVNRRKVAYLRELQVCLEYHHLHENTYEALDVLVKNKELSTRSFQGNRWYFRTDLNWDDVEPIALQKRELIEFYVNYPRDFKSGNVLYDDYSEFLVERALIDAGYVVVSKNAYYFNGNAYRQSVGPGRPKDLDFIVCFPPKNKYLGLQIKNRLEYPKMDDVYMFLDICHTLHVLPILVTRISHPRVYSVINNVGGKIVIFKRYLLKPEFPRDKFNQIVDGLSIPLGVYRRVPDFLVQKFEGLREEL